MLRKPNLLALWMTKGVKGITVFIVPLAKLISQLKLNKKKYVYIKKIMSIFAIPYECIVKVSFHYFVMCVQHTFYCHI